MTGLPTLQQAFARYLLHDDRMVTDAVESTAKLTAHERLSIYASGYRARLLEALGNDYPVLRDVLGEEIFAALGEAYIGARPSRSFTLRDFGATLAAFITQDAGLAERAALPERAFAAELASFERAFVEAFDATDAVPLPPERLAAVAADAWPQLRFVVHPSVQCCEIAFNTLPVWEAVKVGRPRPALQRLPIPVAALVWRQGLATVFRSLSTDEAALWQRLACGDDFAALCTALTDWLSPEAIPLRAATLLRGWLAEGLIGGLA
jgi:hypothetical protein